MLCFSLNCGKARAHFRSVHRHSRVSASFVRCHFLWIFIYVSACHSSLSRHVLRIKNHLNNPCTVAISFHRLLLSCVFRCQSSKSSKVVSLSQILFILYTGLSFSAIFLFKWAQSGREVLTWFFPFDKFARVTLLARRSVTKSVVWDTCSQLCRLRCETCRVVEGVPERIGIQVLH